MILNRSHDLFIGVAHTTRVLQTHGDPASVALVHHIARDNLQHHRVAHRVCNPRGLGGALRYTMAGVCNVVCLHELYRLWLQ